MKQPQSAQEAAARTFTRSSKGTTKGSCVRTASCLSSDTDSGGGSTPTTTRESRVSHARSRRGTREAAGRAQPQDKNELPRWGRGQGRGGDWARTGLGDEGARVLGGVPKPFRVARVHQSHGKGDCHRAHRSAPRAEAERAARPGDSPSRLDCRGPILPMRRNRHACLEAGTYSCVTCGPASLAQCVSGHVHHAARQRACAPRLSS